MLFTVGIGIRKLIESGKLSLEVQSRPIELRKAPLTSKRVPDVLNLHHANEFYDVEAAQPAAIPIVKLCHSIVHSYVVLPTFTYSGPSGLQLHEFLLASDRDRRTHACVLDWREFVATVVQPVVTDDVIDFRSIGTGQGEELRIPLSTLALMSTESREVIEIYAGLSKENAKAVRTFAKRFVEVWGRPHPDLPNQPGI